MDLALGTWWIYNSPNHLCSNTAAVLNFAVEGLTDIGPVTRQNARKEGGRQYDTESWSRSGVVGAKGIIHRDECRVGRIADPDLHSGGQGLPDRVVFQRYCHRRRGPE